MALHGGRSDRAGADAATGDDSDLRAGRATQRDAPRASAPASRADPASSTSLIGGTNATGAHRRRSPASRVPGGAEDARRSDPNDLRAFSAPSASSVST